MDGVSDSEFITANEAAALLGVSVTTLYNYVGRKGIRSQSVPGSRARRYWKPDVLQLRRDVGLGSSAPASGELRRESALTLRTETGPFYRGVSALSLSETSTLEDVAALMWNCSAEEVFDTEPLQAFAGEEEWRAMLSQMNNVDRALTLFPRLEQADPRAFDLSSNGMARTGADVVRWMTTIMLGGSGPSSRPVHKQAGLMLRLDPPQEDLVRRFLVISADHGLETGVFAVRAAASTGLSPWRTVMTGLLVAGGRRSALVRRIGARRLLADLLRATDPVATIVQQVEAGAKIEGFGSAHYGGKDPRARALMSLCALTFADDPRQKRVNTACAAVWELLDLEPDFAFACVVVEHLLGLGNNDSLFLVGRTVGWIAHSIEQFTSGTVEYDQHRYLGPLPS